MQTKNKVLIFTPPTSAILKGAARGSDRAETRALWNAVVWRRLFLASLAFNAALVVGLLVKAA